MRIEFKIAVIYLVTLMLSCQGSADNDRFIVVEKYNSRFLEDSTKNLAYDYYSGNNIIIPESSEMIYYHNTKLGCGTGWRVSDPPLPIDFGTRLMFQFNSVKEIIKFLKIYPPTPKLLMFVSDSDTIRNPNYFEIVDSIGSLKNAYVVARRKVTRDEGMALQKMNYLEIDMNVNCELEELINLKVNLEKSDSYPENITRFLELSDKQCQYFLDYEILYQELVYLFVIKSTDQFLTACSSINRNKRRNIELALERAFLLESEMIAEALKRVQNSEVVNTEWVLKSIEENLKYIPN